MNKPGVPEPAAAPAVERYLAEFTAGLPGPPRAQAGIVAELRSGLLDAVDAYRAAGLAPAEAASVAIREFGDPAQVAGGFRTEIAAGQARRVAVAQLATAPARLSPVLAAAAVAASLARLLFARHATRQCLAIRASLA